jgi:hypothetical protein
MILPLRLIWKLQIPLMQKVSIGGIFGVGFICVIAATIRLVQIGVESGSDTTPSSSWLAFWAIIEASIGTSLCLPPPPSPMVIPYPSIEAHTDSRNPAAVVVGCLPSFAVFYRSARSSNRRSSPQYYENRPTEGSKKTKDSVVLTSVSRGSLSRNTQPQSAWEREVNHSSQEELTKSNQIAMTRTIQVDYRRVSDPIPHTHPRMR